MAKISPSILHLLLLKEACVSVSEVCLTLLNHKSFIMFPLAAAFTKNILKTPSGLCYEINPDRGMLMYSCLNFKHTAPFSVLTKNPLLFHGIIPK